jgi:hypothetical protein
VIDALASITLMARICTQILSNASIDLQGVPISDPSLLMVSENSPYM